MEIHTRTVKIYYEEQGEGLPVCLLHGFPFDHTIWRSVVPLLARVARVITPDLRGHGRSEDGPGTATMPALADDLVGLLDGLGIRRAVVVGHSMGGYAALAFSRLYPERLAGLGLVASQAASDEPEQARGRLENARLVAAQGIGSLADSMPQRLTRQSLTQDEIRQVILRARPSGAAAALRGMAERVDSTPLLSQIRAPAILISGADDQIVPRQRVAEMSRLIPAARWVEIPGAGHLPMLEAPQAVSQALVEFIRQIGVDPEAPLP